MNKWIKYEDLLSFGLVYLSEKNKTRHEDIISEQSGTLEQSELLAFLSALAGGHHQSKLKVVLRAGNRSVYKCAQGSSTSLEFNCGVCGHISKAGRWVLVCVHSLCQKCEERGGCLVVWEGIQVYCRGQVQGRVHSGDLKGGWWVSGRV